MCLPTATVMRVAEFVGFMVFGWVIGFIGSGLIRWLFYSGFGRRKEAEMAGLNKVMIIGNLGADPEMKYTADGHAVTTFRVAASRHWTKDGERQEETEWFSIVTWRKLAEICSEHLQKGRRVYVEGRLQTRKWDSPDGGVRFRTEVIANEVQFLDSNPGGGTPTHTDADYPEDIPFE